MLPSDVDVKIEEVQASAQVQLLTHSNIAREM